MRTLGFVGLVLVMTAYVAAAGIVAALLPIDETGWGIVLVSIGAVAMSLGPSLLYALTGYWDVRRSEAAKTRYRRYLVFAGISAALGTASFITWGVLAAAPWWVTALFVALGVGVLLAVVAAAPTLQRAVQRMPVPSRPPWEDVARVELRRVGRASLISLAIAVVASSAAAVALLAALGALSDIWFGVVGVLVVAIIAGVVPVFIATFRWNGIVKEALDGDMGMAPKLARVVLKNKSEDLSEAEQRMAARYAAVVWMVLVGQLLIQIPILFLIALPQLARFISSDRGTLDDVFFLVILVLVIAAVAFAIPVTIRQVRRARRYAEDHRDLLTANA